jgi:hypothetical protein
VRNLTHRAGSARSTFDIAPQFPFR